MDQVNSLRARIFGYQQHQMNLVNWYRLSFPSRMGNWVIVNRGHMGYLIYHWRTLKQTSSLQTRRIRPWGFQWIQNKSGNHCVILDGRAGFRLFHHADFQVSNMQMGDITIYSYYSRFTGRQGELMACHAQRSGIFAKIRGLSAQKPFDCRCRLQG